MGLSSKVVSNDGLDWKSHNNLLQDQAIVEIQKPFPLKRQLQQNENHHHHQQQQKMEHLKCPRCDSTNTKFCYYNNYNKSQPRHFCKSCKRHWTKGGTLRNVPVGGGRKNKRPKTSNSATTVTTSTTSTTTTAGLAFKGNIPPKSVNNSTTNQAHQQSQDPNMPLAPIGGDDQKGFYEILSQAFMRPPYPISQPAKSVGFNEEAVFDGSITVPLSQDLSLTPQIFPFLGSSTTIMETSYSSMVSSSTTTTSNSSTSQCSSSNILCNSSRDHHFQAMSDSTITSVVPTTMFNNFHHDHQPTTWNLSNSIMDMSGFNWNWDDIDTLVSTNNPNMSWDNNDSEIKP